MTASSQLYDAQPFSSLSESRSTSLFINNCKNNLLVIKFAQNGLKFSSKVLFIVSSFTGVTKMLLFGEQ